MDDTIADRVKARLTSLKGLRQPLEAEYADCYRYTYPERSGGLQGTVQSSTDSKAQRAEIYDDTAKDATRILASSFAAGLTPANSLWFGLDAGGKETDEESRWLDDAAQFLFDNIHAANFDAAAFECYIDMASGPGMFVLYVDEVKGEGLQFEPWPFGQCYVSASKPGGRIDTIVREFQLTVDQVVRQFGIDKVSAGTREKHANNQLEEMVSLVRLIEPRKVNAGAGAKLAKNKPFASITIELSDATTLRESGYDDFPCMVPRWMLIPGTAYATGPMSSVLATVKTLNKVKELELINLEFAAFGMYKARDDGVMNPHTTTIGPRRVVVVADMDNFVPMQPAGDFKISNFAAEEMQRSIRKLMLADQLQPQDGPAMTATEVHARVMLVRQQLGPIFGRLQAEWLGPLVERCFGLAFAAGVLEMACGAIPQTLRGKTLSVKYSSPLARAQKLEELTAIDTWVGGLVEYAGATQDSSVLDEINVVEIAKFKRDALGVPSIAQRSEDDVKAIRQNRVDAAKAQQAQAQQQEIQTTAANATAQKLATA